MFYGQVVKLQTTRATVALCPGQPIYVLSPRERKDGFSRDWEKCIWPAAVMAKGLSSTDTLPEMQVAPIYPKSYRERNGGFTEVGQNHYGGRPYRFI